MSQMEKKRLPVRLLARAFRNELDEKDRAELESWMKEPGNRDLYAEAWRFWDDVQGRASEYDPDGVELWERFRRKVSRRRKSAGVIRMAAAVAAAVLVILAGVLCLSQAGQREPDIVAVKSMSGKSGTVLPDGTVVWLNSASSIKYDNASFGRRDRAVTLDGEAYFNVAKDLKKEFTVSAGGLSVRVTGTSFNVKESGRTVVVSLAEGSVELSSPSGDGLSLVPGEKAVFDRCSGKLSVIPGNVSCDICWARESLNFKSRPIGEICRYLSVWYGVPIRTVPSLEDEYAYTFTVTDEQLEEILVIMGRINPIEYEVADGVYTIRELR